MTDDDDLSAIDEARRVARMETDAHSAISKLLESVGFELRQLVDIGDFDVLEQQLDLLVHDAEDIAADVLHGTNK